MDEGLDATETLKRLQAAGIEIGPAATVTLRPITLVPPDDREGQTEGALEAAAQAADVTYEAIVVRVSTDATDAGGP